MISSCAGGREFVNPKDRPNLTQRCKRFATASTFTQVVFCLGATSRRWASIIKGLVLEYLTSNNQGRRQKNFQERAIETKKKRAIAHQENLPLLAVAD